MIKYPLRFMVTASSPAGIQSPWQSSVPEAATQVERKLICAIPPEFEGPGDGFSPEDFFAMAIANCFVATFKVLTEKSRISFESISVLGKLTVDRQTDGKLWMSEMDLDIHVATDRSERVGGRVHRILEKTAQSCLVANSVRTRVSFSFKIDGMSIE